MTQLPTPELIRCYFEDGLQPRLPVMALRWDKTSLVSAEQVWNLPEGVSMTGPPPEKFGVTIQRRGGDAYKVRLVWNRTCMSWSSLGRADLLGSDLACLLRALGTELWYLLDQPAKTESSLPRKAA